MSLRTRRSTIHALAVLPAHGLARIVFILVLILGVARAQQPADERIIVGSEEDFPPFATGRTDATAGGFTVDLWKHVAAEHGLKYTIRVRPFRQLLEEFKAGKIDVMINLAQSEERRAFADFSVPHVIVHGAIFVRRGESAIHSATDLAGKSIIVLNADLAHDYAVSQGWGNQLVLVNTVADGLKLLASGQHDAMLISKLAGMQTLLALKIHNVKALDATAGFSQKFSVAVRKGNSELLAKINEGLAISKSTGAYDALYEKWFGVFDAPEVSFRHLLQYIAPVGLALMVAAGLFLMRHHERSKSERRLRDSEERLRLAMSAAHQGLFDLNVQTGDSIVSPEYALMLGYDPGEFRESNAAWSERLHPDDREASVRTYADYLAGKTDEYRVEFRQRTKDGGWKWIQSLGSLVARSADGQPLRMLGTHTDITERKQAAIEREDFDHKMQETQKLESLGVLAGGIAHDFNNLLTSVLGNASIAAMELPPGSPVQDCLEQITEASLRAADLCKQMLAYSGRGRFVVQRLDLSQIVEQTAQMLQISISKKAVLRFDLDRDLPPVEVDATQIRQVIMNLVINASEAIGDTSGVTNISTGLTRADRAYLAGTLMDANLPEGDYVFLEVSDNGCGMSAETQARIFDPFFTTKFTGRGLGLAAVLGIVRGHKGTMKVYSEVGRGTTFKLLFPAARGAAEAASGASAVAAAWRGKGTVLVVDDEANIRSTVVRMLSIFGLEAVLASDGREAVEIFGAAPDKFTLVLLDLTMPHMDGEQTFAELRRLRSDVSVVLMSGFNAQEAMMRFPGKGLADFLQKPFTVSDLRAVLQGVLG